MKARHLISILFIIIISMHFVATGLAGSQSQEVTENFIIEKAVPSIAFQNTLKSDDHREETRSIFSRTTIISLIVAVIGIVAFRRNTYS